MATEYPGNIIPAPFYAKGNVSTDVELLYSMQGYTQKGVTLKAGQGVLPTGTVLARETSTKKYVKYAAGGSGGTGEAVGILRKGVDTGLAAPGPNVREFLGNIVIMGIVKLSVVSAANSGAPAGAITDLGAKTNAAMDTFKF